MFLQKFTRTLVEIKLSLNYKKLVTPWRLFLCLIVKLTSLQKVWVMIRLVQKPVSNMQYYNAATFQELSAIL